MPAGCSAPSLMAVMPGVRSFQGDGDQGGRQRGHSQQPGSSRRANRGGRENGRRRGDSVDHLARADRPAEHDSATDKSDAGDSSRDGVRRASAGQVAEDGGSGADQGEGPVARRRPPKLTLES
jgi:hypothetical protein